VSLSTCILISGQEGGAPFCELYFLLDGACHVGPNFVKPLRLWGSRNVGTFVDSGSSDLYIGSKLPGSHFLQNVIPVENHYWQEYNR
jgi:hypothetical protein